MFTKVYKEERQLLLQTKSAVAYEVYMHLKDKYNYFNAECYDLTRCISDYLEIPERTIKDAIKRLKKVGLITTKLKGKVNMYSFPILDKIEGKEPIKEEMETNTANDLKTATTTEFIEDLNNTTETEETTENMGTFIGYIGTPTQGEKFDNFSDTLYKLIDEYENIINHTTEAIAKAELSDDVMVVYQAKQAKLKLREISEKLIEEIDKTNFNQFIMERVEIKKKYIAA